MTEKHYSDCSMHNEPAYPAGECDCHYQRDELRAFLSKLWNSHCMNTNKIIADEWARLMVKYGIE